MAFCSTEAIPEIVRHGSCSDYEVIVFHAADIGNNSASIEVDARYFGEQEAHIGCSSEDGSHRLGDIVC